MPRRKNAAAAKKITVDSENHGEVEVEAIPAAAAAATAVEQPVAAVAAESAAAGNEQQPAVADSAAAATSRPTLEIPVEQPAVAAPQQVESAATTGNVEVGKPNEEKTLLQRLYDWLMT